VASIYSEKEGERHILKGERHTMIQCKRTIKSEFERARGKERKKERANTTEVPQRTPTAAAQVTGRWGGERERGYTTGVPIDFKRKCGNPTVGCGMSESPNPRNPTDPSLISEIQR